MDRIHVMTIHLPLPGKHIAALLLAADSQFAGISVHGTQRFGIEQFEIWATATASVEIAAEDNAFIESAVVSAATAAATNGTE